MIKSGTVSHATCDLKPVASPAAPDASVNPQGPDADRVSTWTHSAAASPVMSLSGRTEVNQYSGEVTVTKVAASGQTGDSPRASARRNSAATASRPSVPANTLTRASATTSDDTTQATPFVIRIKSG